MGARSCGVKLGGAESSLIYCVGRPSSLHQWLVWSHQPFGSEEWELTCIEPHFQIVCHPAWGGHIS